MNKIKLKPCPFCGSQNVYVAQPNEIRYFIACGNCEASSGYFPKEQRAIKAWNKRVTEKDDKP